MKVKRIRDQVYTGVFATTILIFFLLLPRGQFVADFPVLLSRKIRQKRSHNVQVKETFGGVQRKIEMGIRGPEGGG